MQDETTNRLNIIETLNRYAWGYDTRDLALLGDCFTADGTFDIRLEGHEGWGPYRGREAIVSWLSSVMEGQTDQRRHCVTNVVFNSLRERRASVASYLVLTAVENGTLQVVCTGTYHDEVVLDGDRWRISRKTLKLDNAF